MNTADLRRTILDASDMTKQKVSVKEWGVDVWVRTLSGAERDRCESDWIKRRKLMGRPESDQTDFRAFVACWCVCDEDGKRIFDTHSDVNALTKKSCAALQTIWNVAGEMNRFTASDVEELAGNSEAGESAGSTSDLL